MFLVKLKSKIACKSVCSVPSKSLKSYVACKRVSNITSRLLKPKFTHRLAISVPSKYVNHI